MGVNEYTGFRIYKVLILFWGRFIYTVVLHKIVSIVNAIYAYGK